MTALTSHTTFDSLAAFSQSVFWSKVLRFHEDVDDPNRPGDEECMIFSGGGRQRLPIGGRRKGPAVRFAAPASTQPMFRTLWPAMVEFLLRFLTR